MAVGHVRWLLRIFFRSVQVTGLENVPESGGGVVVSWHPNALIDGALILATFPRRIVFGARHGLFSWPLLGAILRAFGTVRIYRRQDLPGGSEDARRAANQQSLDELAHAVAGGAYSALFPEGDSHDEPSPTELKTGAARLYYRAYEVTPDGAPHPVIVPVGLHYDQKRAFGSRALVAYHPPLELDPKLAPPLPAEAAHETRKERYRALTDALERALHEVVHATESWELHHTMHRARTLVRAERAHRANTRLKKPDMRERILGFSRLWKGYNERARTHPDEVRRLTERVRAYDAALTDMGVADHELDRAPRLATSGLGVILFLQVILVYLVLPPILLVGYVANLPAAAAVWGISKGSAKKHKDEASLKLVMGLIAFPLSWLAVALLVAWGKTALQSIYPEIPGAPWVTGVLAFALSALGAYVALIYQRLARQTLRSVRVRWTRLRQREHLRELLQTRSTLYDEIMALASDLELPGHVAPDGRITSEEV